MTTFVEQLSARGRSWRDLTPDVLARLSDDDRKALGATMAPLVAAARERATRSLVYFAENVDIPTVPPLDDVEEPDGTIIPARRVSLAKHHALICNRIQAVVDGTDRVDGRTVNLMLFFPPGSAKSTYADVVAVPWFMATRKRARGNVILASYASDIAAKQGRRARQLVNSSSFQSLFPVQLLPEKKAADDWALTNGNEFMAGGILSGLTGNRCALGILDDPIRGRQAAESETVRNTTWDAYLDDFCSRLIPSAPQIMILTRWHQDDPAGRILPENWNGESGLFEGRDGRLWRVLCVPAIAEQADDPLDRQIGEGLWPEWFPMSHWEPFKKNARSWSSLYQQRPSPDEGTYFQRDWFVRGKPWPAAMHRYMTSDHARTDDGGDYTVIRVWGVDSEGALWALDGWRGQKTADVWYEEAAKLIRLHEPLCWFPENDATWGSVEPFVKAAMRRDRVFCRIEPLSTRGDKPAKARSFQAMAAGGMVNIPHGEEWDEVVNEYLRFPSGKHDDEVDAAAHMGRALADAHPAITGFSTDWDEENERSGADATTGY